MTGLIMGFTLLGSLGVEVDGTERRIGSGPQRIILAALLLRPNQVVSADHLSTLVWDDAPPAGPRQALNNHVMRLRKAMGPAAERIKTQSPGWIVDVRPGELDLHRFDELYRDACSAMDKSQWNQAAELLDAAMSQWRGDALLDVPSRLMLLEAGEHLAERRLLAQQARIDIDLRLGHFDEAIGRVRQIMPSRPLYEGLHGRLIIALYGSGRQSEALTAYQEIREILDEELGIEPGEELRALHQGVLRQQPVAVLAEPVVGRPSRASAAASATARPQAPDPVPLVESSASHAAIDAAQAWPAAVAARPVPKNRLGPRRRWLTATPVGVLAAALFVFFWKSLPDSSDTTRRPPADSAPASPAVQRISADGQVAYEGRIGSDAKVLTTSDVEVPVLHATNAHRTVIVTLSLSATSAGTVTVTDTAGNRYTMIGDVIDAYWHRTMLFAAFDTKPLATSDRISASYPTASKYHLAVDIFRGLSTAGEPATASSLYGHHTSAFTTSGSTLTCHPGDLLISSIATNSGTAPHFTDGWQALPELKLSSYSQTTGYQFISTAGKCAATGSTTAQFEVLAVVLHR